MKYLFIDTWNGQGYSESKAYIKTCKNDAEALIEAKKAVDECTGFSDEFKIEQIGEFKGGIYTRPLGYSYDDGEDAGAVVFQEWIENTIGVILKPNINDYEVFTKGLGWDEILFDVKKYSEDYQEENVLYGNVHHCMSDDADWILFSGEDLLSEFNLENLEFEEGGDGVDYELWKNPETNQLYKVPIEIVRNFKGAETVGSYHEAKFGK